jgi:hypothetical protein
MAERIRYVKDIGMYAFSRGRQSCLWKTPWCARYCYNNKFYQVNPKLDGIDKDDNTFWRGKDSGEFVDEVKRVTDYNTPERFRFAVRGEIWAKKPDVEKVMLILKQMPDTLFWIPTRAWQDRDMHDWIGEMILPLPNARVMASLDPTNSVGQQEALQRLGWSIVFTGDNSPPDQLLLAEGGGTTEKRTAGMYLCPKTWGDDKGHCAVCTEGCFAGRSVAVHLKKHR